jgi:hypothetical protein
LSNEEKTNDYENLEKGMIYMKILKKGEGSREKGEEETKSMPHAPVVTAGNRHKQNSWFCKEIREDNFAMCSIRTNLFKQENEKIDSL